MIILRSDNIYKFLTIWLLSQMMSTTSPQFLATLSFENCLSSSFRNFIEFSSLGINILALTHVCGVKISCSILKKYFLKAPSFCNKSKPSKYLIQIILYEQLSIWSNSHKFIYTIILFIAPPSIAPNLLP